MLAEAISTLTNSRREAGSVRWAMAPMSQTTWVWASRLVVET